MNTHSAIKSPHKKAKKLYFSAIILQGALYEKIESIKKSMARQYHCLSTLKSPAHITIYRPTAFSPLYEGLFFEALARGTADCKSFEIQTNGIQKFGQKTLYLGVDFNKHLFSLQDSISTEMETFMQKYRISYTNKNGKPKPKLKSKPKLRLRLFVPHISIINRDISAENLLAAEKQLRNLHLMRKMHVSEISALVFNTEQAAWNTLKTFALC